MKMETELKPLPMMPRLAQAGVFPTTSVAPIISTKLLDNRNHDGNTDASETMEVTPYHTDFSDYEMESIVSIESMETIDGFVPHDHSFVAPGQADILIFAGEDLGACQPIDFAQGDSADLPCRTMPEPFDPTSPALHSISDSESESGSESRPRGQPNHALASLYTSPVHIAIAQGTALSVLKLIVQAGPSSVLLQRDGPHGLTPLALSLQTNPEATEVHRFLLKTQPHAARLAHNGSQQLPLHLACQCGADVSIISALVQANPSALYHANLCGLTPLDIVWNIPHSYYRSRVLQLLQ